jgi:probable F420-dependent oxidoreductase
MQLGLFSITMGINSRPEQMAETARAAEDAGFDTLWAGEHVVLPDPRVPPSPMDPGDHALDPLIGLTWAAAHTTAIRLATGIVILPQRNPVVLAKQLASLDVLSHGRLVFGVGVGYLEPEFRAIGANFAQRGAVTDEYLDALAHLWYEDHPAYHGRFVDFAGIDAHPRPVQQPVPLVIGGHSSAALKRAVARAHGWFGFALDREGAARCIEGLRRAATEVDRPSGFGEIELTIAPRGHITPERIDAYAELGVHRIVALPDPHADRDDVLATIERTHRARTGG